MTIRFHGELILIVGRNLYSVPSLRVSVATPRSAAAISCVRPPSNVTIIVTTGAPGQPRSQPLRLLTRKSAAGPSAFAAYLRDLIWAQPFVRHNRNEMMTLP